ncbi:hypothetical protein Kpho02_52300 [Kitasatospora phosalacinea]|uniref:Uncharacterized protein n=1 Tax=Kitasatospora phosalacinea TaxID=2065 RepID=A0A9W6V2R1_9ACTN|nr:hypothetical protein Kpho02_52300 [Kitasatospora phosalacinea]
MEFRADQRERPPPAALAQVQGGLGARHARSDHDDPVRCPQLSHAVHPSRARTVSTLRTRLLARLGPALWWGYFTSREPGAPG